MKKPSSIQGYASLFGIKDKDRDVVSKDAFQSSIRAWRLHSQWPKMLWQHHLAEPIGIWKHIHEDDKGLYVQGELNLETQRGAEAQSLVNQGAIDDLSIGYRTLKARWNHESKSRELLDVDLLEISLVTLGANLLARIEVGVNA